MGERKVLNFYVPPDFDASIIPRQKRDKTKLIEVRTMLPFSMRCNTCGEYMYRGKKFTAKKEMIQGEEYMRIRKFRFHIHCSVCSAVIVFKTDPKNSDYEMESGGSRNFEVWRDDAAAVEKMEKEREEEDNVDAMKALENRTMDNKVEMDVLDALDEIQAINQRHERIDTAALIQGLHTKAKTTTSSSSSSSSSSVLLASGITAEDEELVKSIRFRQGTMTSSSSSSGEISVIRALPDSDDEDNNNKDHSKPSGSKSSQSGLNPTHSLAAQVQQAIVNNSSTAGSSSSSMNASTPGVTVLIKKKAKRSETGSIGEGIATCAKEDVQGANKKQKTSNDAAVVVAPTATAAVTASATSSSAVPTGGGMASSSLSGLMAYGSDSD